MTMLAIYGMVLSLLGGLILYLASPNQLLWTRALPRRLLALAGAGSTFAGLVLLLRWAGPATAVFIAFTAVMLVWTIVPLAAAWLRGDRKAVKKGATR